MKRSTPTTHHWRGLTTVLLGSLLVLAACAAGNSVAQARASNSGSSSKDPRMKIRLIVGEQVATATLYDNATAKDFASLLPLSLTMTDYDTIERVSDLPRKLSTQGAPEGVAPVAGELTHYAPWGNLAIFIKPRSYSRSLLPLGKIDDGLAIVSQPGPYKMRIERVEP
ncbi:hypothetical protein FYK61_11530 [Xanthomonas citri]|nr:hypothetical protein [Solirubrobacter deserti]QOY21978.1 hypothetical protein FYK61_11530 [Xanthomonas citri]QQK68120.1 hypothetical protein G3566_11515 [Xanthomonas citri]